MAALTIDELAREAGVVVSTVRLYQSKGLLQGPVRHGRVGHYDEGHLSRLRLIGQLQSRGFSLAGIKELLDGLDRGESLRGVLGVGEGASTWVAEPPQVMTLAELAAALPGFEPTLDVLQRASDLGLLTLDEASGQVSARSSFLRIGSQLMALGFPVDVILDQYEVLQADAERIAARFTELFRSSLWQPFVEGGMPAERVGELAGVLEQLGPLAEAVVVMSLRRALQQGADRFLHDEAARLGIEIPAPGADQLRPR